MPSSPSASFYLKRVEFLGHIIFGEGIRVDTQNIELVQSLRRPISPTDFMSFLDLEG